MAKPFHIELLRKLGYDVQPYDLEYRWFGEVAPAEVISQIESLPDNEAEFISVDLTACPVGLQAYQCGLIRGLRSQAYKAESDGLKFAAEYDGTSLDNWRSKVAEIHDRYPWPGEYR